MPIDFASILNAPKKSPSDFSVSPVGTAHAALTTSHKPTIGSKPVIHQSTVAVNSAPSKGLEVYYDPATKDYHIPEGRGGFVRISPGNAVHHLFTVGVCKEDIAEEMYKIRTQHNVDYIGSLAGFPVGVHEIGDRRVLITSGPKPVVPSHGSWQLLQGILSKAFGEVQLPYFFGWLHVALKMYQTRKFSPGQALALCGPVNCGKSLILTMITALFGGRQGKPYMFMSGGTTFNSEFLETETLAIDDEAASIDMSSRKFMASSIKQFAVVDRHRCHPKGRPAVMLTPLWRVVICVNDNPHSMQVLPPISADVVDKIMLMKVEKHLMPMPTGTGEERSIFEQKLLAELPAFAYYLLNEWEFPETLRVSRTGVGYYHHPDLLDALKETATGHIFLEILDETLFPNGSKSSPWKGRSSALHGILTDKDSPCSKLATGMLRHSNSCGTLLGELKEDHPDRIQSQKSNGHAVWTILPSKDAPNAGLHARKSGVNHEALLEKILGRSNGNTKEPTKS